MCLIAATLRFVLPLTRSGVFVGSQSKTEEPQLAFDSFVVWLGKQSLAHRSRDSYRGQVESFLDWLVGIDDPVEALPVEGTRDWAVRDYKRF